jgi:Tol biopolymer transport system component
MRLGIANRDGGETRVLQIPTFIPKVAWSKDGKTIYYALPLSLPSDAVLPNDYYDKSLHSIDSFWKMDVDTARQERLIESADMEGKDYDSTEPFLSPKEDLLFFTNRTDGLVYKIAINQ